MSVLLQEYFFSLWNLFLFNPQWGASILDHTVSQSLQHALSSPAFVSSVRIGLTEFCLYLITSLLA